MARGILSDNAALSESMTALKFKYSGIIEVKPLADCPEWLVITRGSGWYETGERLHISYLKESGFRPVNCEAVILMEKTEGAHETTSFSCPYCHAPDRSGKTCDQCGRLL